MEIILRLIFKIFQEVFNKDRERQKKAQKSIQKKKSFNAEGFVKWLQDQNKGSHFEMPHFVDSEDLREPSLDNADLQEFSEEQEIQEIPLRFRSEKGDFREPHEIDFHEKRKERKINKISKKYQTDLKTMIVSQVILGPCKAKSGKMAFSNYK